MNSNLIILPGNGPTNKEWAEKARDFFVNHFKSVTIQYYDHWSNNAELIDIDIELKKLTNTLNTLNGDIVILAKSIGTVLAMYAFYSKTVDASQISNCVFVGLPPEWARANGFDIDNWSSTFAIPSILIQNNNDPVATAEDIRKEQASGRFRNMTLVEVKGDGHMYGDFDEIKKYLVG
ncbi:MAG: hypothetical protein M1113_03305 [Candidatus Thermoplasmatota archaeon]|nr:hypothetical protein [Candidatus Thermoplasmatota archaeon]